MLRLRDAFPEQHVALVSHADPIKTALACFLGAPLDLYDRIEISLGSISVVALHDWGAKILRINDVPSSDGR
jgi:probable phosphoglycerate mutase